MRSGGLGDGVTPFGRLQVDIQPLRVAQLTRPYEDQGSQPQGTLHNECPLIAVQHSLQ